MQMEMIREIESAQPKYIVMVNLPSSWGELAFSSRMLIEWGEKYAARWYNLVGTIEIVNFNTTRYLWNENAHEYIPSSSAFLSILKRKTAL